MKTNKKHCRTGPEEGFADVQDQSAFDPLREAKEDAPQIYNPGAAITGCKLANHRLQGCQSAVTRLPITCHQPSKSPPNSTEVPPTPQYTNVAMPHPFGIQIGAS